MRRRSNRTKRFIAVIIVLLLLISIYLTNQSAETVGNTSNVLQQALSPIHQVIYKGFSGIQNGFDRLFGARGIRSEYEELKLENAKLKEELMILENLKAKHNFLQGEYELIQKSKSHLIQANITGKDPGNYFTRFKIDCGEEEGIRVGDVVVCGMMLDEEIVLQGLVGKVIQTGPHWAKISSIVDDSNNISFKVARTDDYGVIDERVDNGMKGYLFNTQANILVGDYVLTSGLGDTYPANLFIGETVEVDKQEDNLTKNITVKSPVDFTRLSRVFVIPQGGYVEDDIPPQKLSPQPKEEPDKETPATPDETGDDPSNLEESGEE